MHAVREPPGQLEGAGGEGEGGEGEGDGLGAGGAGPGDGDGPLVVVPMSPMRMSEKVA